MKLLWMVAGAALAISTAASADDEADEDDVTREEKVVCKTEKITGSRTRVIRTCMTQKQWDDLAAATRKGVDDLTRDAGRMDSPNPPRAPGAGGG